MNVRLILRNNIDFKLLNACDYYTYDKDYNVWTDRSSDEKYIKELLTGAENITVVGVVAPGEDTSAPILNYGINYPTSLVRHMIDVSKNSEIVKSQLKTPEVDVISGKKFSDLSQESDFDMSSMFNCCTTLKTIDLSSLL